MMPRNPLVTEVLIGITRTGKAQLDYLALLLLQAVVLFLTWPERSAGDVLETQHSPHTLAAVAMTMGASMAYVALSAGAGQSLLAGQHELRDWALATRLSTGRIVRGYMLAQLVQSLHLVALSSPLLAMAFTLSGGEWPALAWCVVAALVQALFFRLCGAIAHLVGTLRHGIQSGFIVWTILLLVYIPVGWLAPITSHLAFTSRALGETMTIRSTPETVMFALGFLTIYGGLSALAALALARLLARERGRVTGQRASADFGETLIR